MSLRIIFALLAAFHLATPASAQTNDCLKAYRHWKNVTAWKVGLTPVFGMGTLAGSGMLAIGWEYGGWTAFKSAIGPTLTAATESAINFVIPTGLAVGTVAVEGIQIARLVQAERAYHLVQSLAEEDPQSPALDALLRRIQKHRPELSREVLIADLRLANEHGELCDGSWSQKHPANLRQMEKALLKLHANAQ
jgi:hypothetical protein